MTASSPQIDVRAPRLAAAVTSVPAVALVTGSGWLLATQAAVFAIGAVATGPALVAALLDAATGSSRGCELSLTARRAVPART
jgi:ABC-type transport system involved in cytochrome bd biosynthesis fused ATPase/permease subunit